MYEVRFETRNGLLLTSFLLWSSRYHQKPMGFALVKARETLMRFVLLCTFSDFTALSSFYGKKGASIKRFL